MSRTASRDVSLSLSPQPQAIPLQLDDAACLSGHLGKFLGREGEFLGENDPSAAIVGSGLRAVGGFLFDHAIGMDVEPSQSRALAGGHRQAILPGQRENGVPAGAFLAVGKVDKDSSWHMPHPALPFCSSMVKKSRRRN